MRRNKIFICSILIFFIYLFFDVPVLAYGEYSIPTYNVKVNVDKSAVFTVVETIDIENCDSLLFKKLITQKYVYDIDKDGIPENYTYGVSDISVEGATFSSFEEAGNRVVEMNLEKASQQIVLSYKVRMRRFDEKDQTTILYSVLDPSMAGSIEQFHMEMEFPNRIDGHIEAYDIDRNGLRGNAVSSQIQDKTLTITSLMPIDPSVGIMMNGTVRKNYFTFSNAFSLHLFFSILSILFVMGSYFYFVFYSKMKNKKTLMECYPIENLKIGSLGYIVDGCCDERDIMSIIIEWGNQNYIQIRDENQTVSLLIKNELPLDAPQYEKHLFNLIFDEYTMVTIDQLKYRQLGKRMKEIEEEIYQEQMKQKDSIIYTHNSVLYQLMYSILVCIPVWLGVFACQYEESYSVFLSFVNGSLGAAFVFMNCLPWIWILKHRYYLSKNTLDVYQLLTGLLNFICMALIYAYLLQHQTPMAYLVITIVLTLLEACVMIFMEKRTYYGRALRSRLLSLRHFICRAKTQQLEGLLIDNAYYFEDMLPYAYYFDIVDIWGKKFTTIPLEAPFWFHHANANANYSIYWMSALDKSLQLIKASLMSTPAPLQSKTKSKKKIKK